MATKTLFKNGKFYTGNNKYETSITVYRGAIVDLGEQEGADHACVIDLNGAVALPTFVDAHCHLLMLGESLDKVDLLGCTTLDDILKTLRSHLRRKPHILRIYARNWIQDMTAPSQVNRKSFDEFTIPVILESYDVHSALLNSAALEVMGIDEHTEAPAGGEIVKDGQGVITGWLKEMAYFKLVLSKIQQERTIVEKQNSIRKAFCSLIEAGYTGVGDLLMDEDTFEVLETLYNEDECLPLRVRCYWHCPPETDIARSLRHIDRAKELQLKWLGNEWLGINGIKFVSDGVIDACTAALLLPYQDGSNPEPLWALSDLVTAVQKADSLGLQCAIHAIGDLAVKNAVEAYATLGSARIKHSRHRIEHLELSSKVDGDQLGNLGITASVQPVHSDPAFLSNWYEQLGGKSASRCCRAFAYKHFLDAGAPLAIGTDAPTAPYLPLPNLHLATTRTSARDPTLQQEVTPEFAVPFFEAVAAATSGAASACHLDQQGSFARYMKADFNILSLSILSPDTPNDQALLKAKIWKTYRAGELVACAA